MFLHRRRPSALAPLAGALAVFASVLAPAPAAAQQLDTMVEGPQAPWRVVATEHFRVHYPEPAEAWARRAAARLEGVREMVAEEVGYAHPQVVDVIVSDPVAQPNGFALPLLGGPRMVLWTSPPGPQSVIGHYRDWGEILLIHEEAHLAHLLRPSRNPLRRWLATVLPVGPILAAAPRWVTEGYATVIEGRLTGSGRPHGNLRAAVLRRWAQAGRLPSYGRLAGDSDSYLGMSMAYLVGSAYLEWLEAEAGEGSLRALWARMTARQARSFEEAFRGVFGAPPAELYARFTAELTWQALELERRIAAGEATGYVDGVPWLDLEGATGAPTVSPSGDRLALVLDRRDDPPELVLWSTAVDEEALERRRERGEEILAADPEDVLSVERRPPPRERLATLPTIDGAAPSEPRFLPDGESLLLVRFLPDETGALRPDLFRWWPSSDAGAASGGRGRLERVTRRAAVRSPDPDPTGTWAVAVRSLYGASRLVRVDLATGAVEPITESFLGTSYDGPRISPDGERLAYARHRALPAPSAAPERAAGTGGRDGRARQEPHKTPGSDDGAGGSGGVWELVVRDLATGGEEILPLPAGATASSPAWGRGADAGTLYALIGAGGFLDVHAFRPAPPGEGAPGAAWRTEPVTRVRGAAFAPEPDPAGGLFFLDLGPDGLDLQQLDPGGERRELAKAERSVTGTDVPQSTVAEAPPAAADEAAAPGDPVRGGDVPDAVAPAELPREAVAELVPVVAPPDPPPLPPLAEAELPPSRPFGLGRQELMLLSGGSSSPGGDRIEIGVRGGDLLGRLDWVVTAAAGDGAGGEGAAAAAAWRGPVAGLPDRLDGRIHLFTAEEDLSTADSPPLAAGLDVERQGVEVAAGWQRRASTAGGLLRVSLGAYAGRTEPVPGPRFSERRYDEESLFAEALWQPRASIGAWRGGFDFTGRYDLGATGGADWQRLLAGGTAFLGHDGTDLALSWHHGDVDDAPGPWQLFQIGGAPGSLLPSTVEAARVLVPALPAATLVGHRFDAQRVDLEAVLPFFYARYRVGGGEWLDLAGVEWRVRSRPVPLLRLPALELTLGVARILSPPFEDETEWWTALAWRP